MGLDRQSGDLPVGQSHSIASTNQAQPDGGIGIGLSICRSIIEAHDGRLRAVPNNPEGAVFQFTLAAGPVTSAGASQGEQPDDIPLGPRAAVSWLEVI
jgi:light-regulated signal transduction histidine kinase (bacteriophytochrome)